MIKIMTKIIAHRGASAVKPENTISSIEKAIAQNADIVEIDVRVTKDGEFVLFHDRKLKRMTGIYGKIKDSAFNLLNELNVDNTTQKIVKLDYILAKYSKKINLLIDLKVPYVEKDLLKLLKKYDLNNVYLQSFWHDPIKNIKKECPELKTGVIFYSKHLIMPFAKSFNANFLTLWHKSLNREYVKKVHRNGLEIYVFTVNNVMDALKYKKWGIDGIITNKPGLIRRAFDIHSCYRNIFK